MKNVQELLDTSPDAEVTLTQVQNAYAGDLEKIRKLKLDLNTHKCLLKSTVNACDEATQEAKHWKANHDNVVSKLKLATQRLDLPADRIQAIAELSTMQEANHNLNELLEEAEHQRDLLQADLVAAAGECLVSVPEPGTDMAKLLIANRLMSRRIENARSLVEASRMGGILTAKDFLSALDEDET